MTDDEKILSLLRRGEPDAAGAAFERYGRMVYNVCLRVLQDRTAADDAVQAVFMLLMRKGRKLGRKTVLSAWLFRSAEFVAREARRAEARRRKREKGAREMSGQAREHKHEKMWGEISPQLDRAIAGLPERWRAPVVLTYLEGRPRAEVARVLGLPEGTLQSRLARALAALRRKLAKHHAALSVNALAAVLAARAAGAAVPNTLAASVVGAAGGLPGGTGAGTAATHLMEAAMKAMLVAKVKVAAGIALAVSAAACAGVGTVRMMERYPEVKPKGPFKGTFTISVPERAAAARKVKVRVTYRGFSQKVKLGCDLHWMNDKGNYGGFMTLGMPYPEVEGDGEHVFNLKVIPRDGLAAVYAVVYPCRKDWNDKLAHKHSPHIRVGGEAPSAR